MPGLHGGVTEEWKLARRRIDGSDVKQTFTIGPTLSITRLITPIALFHVLKVSIASSAHSRVRDISVWFSATAPTEVPASMGRSPARGEGDRGVVTSVDCMASPVDWTVGRPELAFVDTEIINERVIGSAGCVE